MKSFRIAGISMEIDTENQSILNRFKAFESNSTNHPDLSISFVEDRHIPEPQGEEIVNQGIRWVAKGNKYYACYFRENSCEIETMLEIDNTWQNARFTYTPRVPEGEYPVSGRVDEALFYAHILLHNGVVIHGSSIDWEGKGLIFSAPGDTGKSTHANLWKRYLNAKTINDDRPAVRIIDEVPYVYGTPWCGSSREIVNSRSPLEAIVLIEQAAENKIRSLTKQEAVSRIFPRCFLPYYNKQLLEMALGTVEKIIINTPVYLLGCRPDKEAMELVFNCVK